jgi:hypothetical protein
MYVAPEKINVANMLPKNYWEIVKAFHFYFRPLSLGYEEWFCCVASSRELDSSIINASTCPREIGVTELPRMAINRDQRVASSDDIVGFAGERVAASFVSKWRK